MNYLRLTGLGLLLTQMGAAACSKSDDKEPDPNGEAGAGGSSSEPGPTEGGSETAQGGAGASEAGADSGALGGERSDNSGGEPAGDAGSNTGGVGVGGGDTLGGSGNDGAEVELPRQGPATVVWLEDFEGEAADWSITGGVWAVGEVTHPDGPQALSGTGVAGTGLTADYGAGHDAYLISPEIEVPAARDKPRFAFNYWYELSTGDAAHIYIRVDGGYWQVLSSLNQSGDGAWRQMVVNLEAYADQTVEFGFRLITNAANFAPGVFIDDARFETGGQPFPSTDGFEEGWSYWSTNGGVWAIGEPTAPDGPEPHAGDNVAGTILSGDYQSGNDAYLVSPRIEVPAASDEPRVTFKYWYELASGDAAHMYYRVDGGYWQVFSSLNESGDGSWRSITLPLGQFADQTVELGFRLISNAAAFAPGFYVDDFAYRIGPVPLATEQGFEDGWAGWSAYGGVWAVGAPTAADGPEPHAGVAVAGTVLSGDYGSGDDAYLVSPRFLVPEESEEPSVSYWYWYELASGDAAHTYVRVDDGYWQVVSSLDQSGNDAWRKQSIDLSAHKGKTVEVGFRIISNSSAFAPGFYIDDVTFDL